MPAAIRLAYPSPRHSRRPSAATIRQQRRLGHRLARGYTPVQAAEAEQLPEATVTALLADKDFRDLLAGCRELVARPEAETMARLVSLAHFLIEEALIEGDIRAANFILYEDRRGRDGAVTLVEAALRQARAEPRLPAPPTLPSPRQPPASPGPGEQRCTEARLGLALLHELGAEVTALVPETTGQPAEPEPEPAEPEPAAAAIAGQRPGGRHRLIWRAWVAEGRTAEPPAARGQGP